MNVRVNIVFVFMGCFATVSVSSQNVLWPGGTIAAPSQATGKKVSRLGKNIDCMMQDNRGYYWFGSNGEGVFRYDGRQLTNFRKVDGLTSDFVWNIQEDNGGNLWFTARDGFCMFDGKRFIDYTYTIKHAPYGKWQNKQVGLFFGHDEGICFYDGKSFVNITITPAGYVPLPSDRNRPYAVYASLLDKKGLVWFGTQSKGVCRYDGKTWYYLTEKDLAGPAVRTVFQDRSGVMWFGNNGGGLYRYDGRTLSNITEEKGLGNPEFLKGHFKENAASLARVWTINEDNRGDLWVGTIDAGVWRWHGTHLVHYTIDDGLASNAIWKIFKDRQGELWFVAGGEVIQKFDGKGFVRVDLLPEQH